MRRRIVVSRWDAMYTFTKGRGLLREMTVGNWIDDVLVSALGRHATQVEALMASSLCH